MSDGSSDVCSSDLLGWFHLAFLQQFDRDIVRRANKCHVSIAGRAIDRDAGIHQSLTGFVDILDLVSEMPEVATAGIFLRIPVISELDLRILVTGRSKEDEREASFLVIRPPPFLKAQEFEKSDSFVDVPDPDHGMQIFGHVRNSLDRKSTRLNSSHYCPSR